MNMLRLVSLSMLLLFGCNDSSVPLGPAETAPMDLGLAGVWKPMVPPEEGGMDMVTILPFNDHEFYIEYSHIEKKDNTPEVLRLRGFITNVGDATFANIQSIEDLDDRDYLIYWFDLSDENTLQTILIDEDMDHIETSEELLSLVQELLDTNALAEKEMIQFRKEMIDL